MFLATHIAKHSTESGIYQSKTRQVKMLCDVPQQCQLISSPGIVNTGSLG